MPERGFLQRASPAVKPKHVCNVSTAAEPAATSQVMHGIIFAMTRRGDRVSGTGRQAPSRAAREGLLIDRSIRPRTFGDVLRAPDYEEWTAQQDARTAAVSGARMTCRWFFENGSHLDLSTPRLGVGDRAHELELSRLMLAEDGGETLGERVRLSDYADKQPVALIFGSYSCPPFRDSVRALDELYQRYGDRVAFFVIYAKEAHPQEGWVHPRNRRDGVALNDPTTLEQRAAAAARMVRDLALPTPVLVETLAHEAVRAYGAFPIRMYLIGRDGRAAYQGPAGPFGFHPEELEVAIGMELEEA